MVVVNLRLDIEEKRDPVAVMDNAMLLLRWEHAKGFVL